MTPSLQDWAELVRLPAVVSVPGDALVGLAAGGGPVRPRAALLPLASVSMYWAGMALNDWADRDLDAVERPERPLPSGRIRPAQALAAAATLTAAAVGLAGAASGRRGAGVAALLGSAVWTYDLVGKPRAWAPLSMAVTRSLDVALGATGSGRAGSWSPAVLPAVSAGLHTLAVTDLSRGEVHGAGAAAAARAQAATLLAAGTVVQVLARRLLTARVSTGRVTAGHVTAGPSAPGVGRTTAAASTALCAVALARHSAPLLRAQSTAGRTGLALDARRATGAGIKAFLPLQAALLAALGRPAQAVSLVVLATAAARQLRGGSPT